MLTEVYTVSTALSQSYEQDKFNNAHRSVYCQYHFVTIMHTRQIQQRSQKCILSVPLCHNRTNKTNSTMLTEVYTVNITLSQS
jgi:hypothetical protein